MKRLTALIIAIFVLCSVAPVFGDDVTQAASGTAGSTPRPESVFQDMSDGLSDLAAQLEGEKKPLTGTFQRSSDYIEASSTNAKLLSLRGQPDELKKRRGTKY